MAGKACTGTGSRGSASDGWGIATSRTSACSLHAIPFLARFGRLPTRDDVETNPKGVLDQVYKHKVITTMPTPEEGKRWSKIFDETFRKR